MVDKYNVIIIASFIVVAIGIFLFMIVIFEEEKETEIPVSGFPHCLRILECSGVPEFNEIPQDQIEIIASNYQKCLERFQLKQTCEVQINQDIERFFEKGFVSER